MSNMRFWCCCAIVTIIGHVENAQAVTHDSRAEDRSNPLRFACYFWKRLSSFISIFWIAFTVGVVFFFFFCNHIQIGPGLIPSTHTASVQAGIGNEAAERKNRVRASTTACQSVSIGDFWKGCNNSGASSYIPPTYCNLYFLSGSVISQIELSWLRYGYAS